MANNQKKLKAFVRYDGSGRVVASSLILRKNKPRVGRWYEIPEYLCCNGISPSTTTTTTQGGGGTPTAFVQSYWLNTEDACDTTTYGSFVFYSSSPVLEPGIAIFTDAALTVPVTAGLVISSATMAFPRLLVGAEGVLSEFICTTTTTTTVAPITTTTTTTTAAPTTTTTTTAAPIVYSFYNVGPTISNACNGGVPPTDVGVANGDMYNATIAYAQTGFPSGPNATIYIGFTYAGTDYSKQFVTSGDATSATATGGNVAC